jgi:hypothetical protein
MHISIIVGIIFEKGQHSFMQLDEEMVQQVCHGITIKWKCF